jgi:DNA-binding transcriptional LysR family regulator
MDVHLRDLRYFVAVAEQLHFTRAAEALFVSQPALSKQIRALEGQLRTDLFERNRRGVVLTPAGRALLDEAREVLAAWEHAEHALAEALADGATTVTVGISTGVGRGLLPAVRARFSAAAPDARLVLRQVPWGDATAGLAASGDERTGRRARMAAPARRQPVLLDRGRHGTPARGDAGRSPAWPARDAVDFAELLDEPFLALPAASGPLRDFWLAIEDRGGHPAVVGAEVATTEETVEALQAGLGVCLVAEGNAPQVERDGVVTRPVAGVDASRLVLAWRHDDDRPLVSLLANAVAGAARSA